MRTKMLMYAEDAEENKAAGGPGERTAVVEIVGERGKLVLTLEEFREVGLWAIQSASYRSDVAARFSTAVDAVRKLEAFAKSAQHVLEEARAGVTRLEAPVLRHGGSCAIYEYDGPNRGESVCDCGAVEPKGDAK